MANSVPAVVAAMLALFAIGAGGCGGEDAAGGVTAPAVSVADSAMSAASAARAARYEVKFMTDMIDHHQMAIMMAEMCVETAVHDELRAICDGIIVAQSAEIATLQGWLQEWYGIPYEPEMHAGADRMMERFAALSPEEFEIEFMEMMIRHHSRAIREAGKCLDKAEHEELATLCESIIAAQTAEIAQLEEWLCAWYRRC